MGTLKYSGFQGYPKGFKSIFGTQVFFNFSFFGLKSIFVLYALNRLRLDESHAFALFATLMTLSYATSLFGGFLADKVICARSTLIIGGVLSAIGIVLLASSSQNILYLALALLSLGSGCFKPNFSTSLSLLFDDQQDPRKDIAFASLYVGMNVGNLLGPLVCGWLSHQYGWLIGFLPIMVSFVFGTALFYANTHHVKPFRAIKPVVKVGYTPLLLVLAGGTLYFLFKYHDYFHSIMGLTVIVSGACFALIFYRCTGQERTNLLKLIPYTLAFAFFCALFEQAGSSLVVFFERGVDRHVLGYTVPASALLSLNPLLVLMFGLFLPRLSRYYLSKGKAMDGLTKFGIGFLFIALSFGVLAISTYQARTLVSLNWVALSFLLQTVGELLIVPIGFATVSKLAPSRYLSMLMSLWLMAIAYGHYLAGILARFSLSTTEDATSHIQHYHPFFLELSLMALGAAVLLLLNALLKQQHIGENFSQ